MPRAAYKPKNNPPLNPDNVKTISFTGFGQNPKSLIGKHVISATVPTEDNNIHALELTLLEHPKSPVVIRTLAKSKNFMMEASDDLTLVLSRASPQNAIRILGAATGYKQVTYAAPLCTDLTKERLRELYKKRMCDDFELIGLALDGMDEMGWIWAEDRLGSFEEGCLKASVYIADA